MAVDGIKAGVGSFNLAADTVTGANYTILFFSFFSLQA